MFKRSLLIGALVISLVTLGSNSAWAVFFTGGGGSFSKCIYKWVDTNGDGVVDTYKLVCSYELAAEVTGGGQQDKDKVAIMSGSLYIPPDGTGYLYCLNPGSGAFDVNPGSSAVNVTETSTINLGDIEKWGKTEPFVRFPNTVPEFAELLYGIYTQCVALDPDGEECGSDPGNDLPSFCYATGNPGGQCYTAYGQPTWQGPNNVEYGACEVPAPYIDDDDNIINVYTFPEDYLKLVNRCPWAATAFNWTYGVDDSECRNRNWHTYEYIIESGYGGGGLYRNCTLDPTLDEEDWLKVGAYFCEYRDDSAIWAYSTETPFANPPIEFAIGDAPLARDDEFTMPDGETEVTGNVLDNDENPNNGDRTAYVTVPPSYGKLFFNSNGSFTYIRKSRWPAEGDSFKYRFTDGQFDSYNVLDFDDPKNNVLETTVVIKPEAP